MGYLIENINHSTLIPISKGAGCFHTVSNSRFSDTPPGRAPGGGAGPRGRAAARRRLDIERVESA